MNTSTPAAPDTPAAVDPRRFTSFAEFYPFYLTEHANVTCRRLHFAGSTISLLCLVALVVTLNPWWLLAELAQAHPQFRFAWVDIEDHAEIADAFDVETFPTLLVAGADGTRFLGPLLPHIETLSRLLGALQPPQPSSLDVDLLLAVLEKKPAAFAV